MKRKTIPLRSVTNIELAPFPERGYVAMGQMLVDESV